MNGLWRRRGSIFDVGVLLFLCLVVLVDGAGRRGPWELIASDKC